MDTELWFVILTCRVFLFSFVSYFFFSYFPPPRPPPYSFILFHLVINSVSLSLFVTHSLVLTYSFSHSFIRTKINKTLTYLFSVAGMGQCALPRRCLHALVSLRSPFLAAPYLPLLRCGTMCTTKGSDIYLSIPPPSFRCSPLLLRRFCEPGVG